MDFIHIREIEASSDAEIKWVASRMRETLMEVLGQVKGESMYTMEWLVDRVRWHLDSAKSIAKIFLAVNVDGSIVGHAIARIEKELTNQEYGYFSTIYVESEWRRRGVATQLMRCVEEFFVVSKLTKIIYNTATSNTKLISLFKKDGYVVTVSEAEMIQLVKVLL